MADDPVSEVLRQERADAGDEVREIDRVLNEVVAQRIQAGNAALAAELKRLLTWEPGVFYPDRCAETFDAITEEEQKRLESVPFFSEAYLYTILGKENARTVLALMGAVCRAAGYGGIDDLQDEVFNLQREEDRQHLQRVRERVQKLREAGHALTPRPHQEGVAVSCGGPPRPGCEACDGVPCRRHPVLSALKRAEDRWRLRWGEAAS